MVRESYMNKSRVTWRIVSTLSIVFLLVSNLLSITNEKFHNTLYDLLSHLPYEGLLSQSKHNKQIERDKLRAKERNAKINRAKVLSKNIVGRTTKNAVLNASSVLGESVPFLGVGLIVAVTVSDLTTACETIADTNELLTILEEKEMTGEQASVCGMKVPSIGEIEDVIGGTIYHALNP